MVYPLFLNASSNSGSQIIFPLTLVEKLSAFKEIGVKEGFSSHEKFLPTLKGAPLRDSNLFESQEKVPSIIKGFFLQRFRDIDSSEFTSFTYYIHIT